MICDLCARDFLPARSCPYCFHPAKLKDALTDASLDPGRAEREAILRAQGVIVPQWDPSVMDESIDDYLEARSAQEELYLDPGPCDSRISGEY
jgi:hypothetical protein